MAANTAFSSPEDDVISRTIEVEREDVPIDEDFDAYYDILRTVEEISNGNYKRIALQFPDELLHASVPIFRALKSKLGTERELYVLADTSYGSCCVDEVAAQHIDADVMVHYGHACMSQTSRLPVIYVFGKKSIDISDCIARFLDSLRTTEADLSSLTLRTDVAYSYVAEQLIAELRTALPPSSHVSYTPIPLSTRPRNVSSFEMQNDTVTQDTNSDESSVILFVGGESLALTNLLITNSSSEVHSYDPRIREARLESVRSNKLLMRRYVAVQKARDADVFGILVGTLGVASYLPLITRLRSLLARAHKKSYTVTVGKLNPAKLANFLEIECFVLVACPENSLIDAKEFLRPIITPYELEIALQAEPQWDGKYVLDFGKLAIKELPEESEGIPEVDDGRPTFSLVTGQYRSARRYGVEEAPAPSVENDSLSAVALRNQDNTVSVLPDSAAAQFLQSRTFRGLETRVGEDAPSVLEQGQSGIARGYQNDHS